MPVLHLLFNLRNNSWDHSQKNQNSVSYDHVETKLWCKYVYSDKIAFYQIKKNCFNVNQSFRKTFHRLVFCSMFVYFIYVFCYLQGKVHLLGTENNLDFNVLHQESRYNWGISYQMKKEKRSLFWYKSAYSDNIASASYLFNVGLRHAHSELLSNERNEIEILRFPFWLNTFEKFSFQINTKS